MFIYIKSVLYILFYLCKNWRYNGSVEHVVRLIFFFSVDNLLRELRFLPTNQSHGRLETPDSMCCLSICIHWCI